MATRWQGVDNIKRRFAALPDRVKAAAIDEMEARAEELVEEMRRYVPRDSGDLAKSIGWTWGEAPRGAVLVAKGSNEGSYGTLRITIYAGSKAAYYARYVEFGTRPHTTPRGAHPGSRARPFFFPVYRKNKRRIKSGVTRAINRAIKNG